MSDRLLRPVFETLRRYQMVRPGDRVAVAVSGGADSVALLLLLEELQSALGISLLIAHFNHMLRGAGSEEDAEFVCALARGRGMEVASAAEDIAAEARRTRANVEEVARERRYRFFARLVAEGKATRVAVAHTADDQAETLLARLGRGTGPQGLAGIYPVLGDVIRPLLRIRRGELRSYLSGRGQPWREDPSNLDATRLRARIRSELLPLLEQKLSPAVVTHLGWLAELTRAEEAFWSTVVEERFRALTEQETEEISIACADLLEPLPLGGSGLASEARAEALRAVSRRLVRKIFERIRSGRGQLSAEHVEQVLHLATTPTSGRRVRLPAEAVVERRLARLVFLPAKRAAQAHLGAYAYPIELPASGELEIEIAEIGKRFCLKLIDWPRPTRDTKREEQALDAGLLRFPLVLRSWRAGDAYCPKGRRHARKLKRLLLERKIPARDRRGWPVLTSEGRLVWAWRLPPVAEFVANQASKSALVIQEAE